LTHVVKNDWKFNKDRLKSELYGWKIVSKVWHLEKEEYEQELENATLWRDYVNSDREPPNKILVGEKN